ncbi:MAG TPA: MgtC/SapB family protein [Bacillus bacterium]|nr:MgtC/SapB family protein [Bacillus sp. (in: firmicutes)]
MSFRIFISALLCGVIGFEREVKKQPAGFRTHLLVGVGSCLMMLLSLYGFEDYIDNNRNIRFDPARIPSYVISGIGFLGTGTILVKGATIRGLTTAASIWIVAGIGLIVGVGMFAPAVLTTIVVLLSLIFLNKFERRMFPTGTSQLLNIVMDKDCNKLNEVLRVLEKEEIAFQGISIKTVKGEKGEADKKKITIQVNMENDPSILAELQDKISRLEFVHQTF